MNRVSASAGRPRSFAVDTLRVSAHVDPAAAGTAAGQAIAEVMRRRLAEHERIRVVFASAPSQDHALATLAEADGIAWSRVVAFHMDEYVGLGPGHPRSFGTYLTERLFSRVRPGQVHLMDLIGDPHAELARYSSLVTAAPLEVVLLGVGENGHLAFNEPGAAFDDPMPMRLIRLDGKSRQQQVNDGCFESLDDVPTDALTLTLPTLLSARSMVVVVSGIRKHAAISAMLDGPVATSCPASALREHADAQLFADDAALDGNP